MRHVLDVQQFDPKLLSLIFKRTSEIQSHFKSKHAAHNERSLSGKMMFNIFYEPSTRTRISFASAAHFLGMEVVNTENAREFSSAIKGESLEDTIKVLCQYNPTVIVLRHNEEGSALRAANVSTVPIINAGDGGGQHPTQALLDLYTINQSKGRTSNLSVAIGTDLLHSRTTRSLCYLLAQYPKNSLILVSPKTLRIGNDLRSYLIEKGTNFEETDNLDYALSKADVVYWNRIQKERFTGRAPKQTYIIGPPQMDIMKRDAILMDPLPRVDQIDPRVDSDKRAIYFEQAGNGMFVRMALLEWVTEIF